MVDVDNPLLASPTFTSGGRAAVKQSIKNTNRLPAEEGVWVFIIGDMLVFSVLFGAYAYYRNLNLSLFQFSQTTLNQHCGVINTFLLLTSSWFVASGVNAVREGKSDLSTRLFSGAFLCGIGFIIIKLFEYSEKIRDGITLVTKDFYMFFFILTGIHFFHVLFGMLALTLLILKSRRGDLGPDDIRNFESGGAYWHMVDLLWIVLFTLLYLVR